MQGKIFADWYWVETKIGSGAFGELWKAENILNKLKGATDKKIILVLNKIDIIKKEELLTLATYFNAQLMFQEIFMVSALKGDGLKDVVKYLENNMCHDLWYFEEDQVSDQQLSQIACEITREKIYKFLLMKKSHKNFLALMFFKK